jgi:TonB-dependent receptor
MNRSLLLLFLCSPSLFAQVATIKGYVADLSTGQPLPSANVRIASSLIGGVARNDGSYLLKNVPYGDHELVIGFIGYESHRQKISITSSDTTLPVVFLKPSALRLSDIVIEDRHILHTRALARQRSASHLVNVATEELLSAFPDPNAAEALQRLPSISIQRDQGEGRYVVLRGLEPKMTTVLINGERSAISEELTRQVPLDVVPRAILGEIEVHKTLTPDMDADAVAGVVNLQSRSAFDRGIPSWSGALAGGFNPIATGGIVDAQITRSLILGEKHGLLISGSMYETHRGSDDVEMIWSRDDFGQGPVYAIQNQELRDYLLTRKRYGLGASWDYRSNREHAFYARAFYTRFHDDEVRRRLRLRYDRGQFTTATEMGATVTDADLERETKETSFRRSIGNFQVGSSNRFGRLSVHSRGSYSRAKEWIPYRRDITFRVRNVDLRYDLDHPNFPAFEVTNGINIHDPSFYRIKTLFFEEYFVLEDEWSTALNATFQPVSNDIAQALQWGLKWRRKNRTRDHDRRRYDSYTGPTFTMDQVSGEFEDRDFLDDRYRIGPLPGPKETDNFLNTNFSNFVFNPGGSKIEDDPRAYGADETVVSGYAMGMFRSGELTIVPGIRFEKTYLNYRGNRVRITPAGTYDTTFSTKGHFEYYYFFPGVNINYDMTREAKWRFAVTRSLARPDYYDLVPYELIDADDQSLSRGNPLLKPALAINVDAGFEYYSISSTFVSVNIFLKNIDRFIYPRAYIETTGPFAGYRITDKMNGKTAQIWGLELAVHHRFPNRLKHFGFSASYTFTQSDASFPGRSDEMRLPGQGDHTWNMAVLYDRRRFSARFAATYHSAYLFIPSTDPSDDIFMDRHFQLDASLSYRFTKWLSGYVEFINLTDQPYVTYQGSRRQKTQQEFYSWWGHAGMRFEF